MEKFYQGWVERDDGSMGMVTDATTIEECEKQTLEIVQHSESQPQEHKVVALYVCCVEPVKRMSLEHEWTDV